MVHLVSHFVQKALEELGMSRGDQLITFSAVLLLAFALYAGKQFAKQKVYATLYLALALSFCVFLTTEHERTRMLAGTALLMTVAALFAWYFATAAKTAGRDARDAE